MLLLLGLHDSVLLLLGLHDSVLLLHVARAATLPAAVVYVCYDIGLTTSSHAGVALPARDVHYCKHWSATEVSLWLGQLMEPV